MEKESLHELEICEGTFQIKLVRHSPHPGHSSTHVLHQAPVMDAPPVLEEEEEVQSGLPVKSPIAGIFYRARSPQSPPFVSVGDMVRLDQPMCIIEAMKVMNEITAKVAGRVEKILVENGKPVEANQTLFIIQSD